MTQMFAVQVPTPANLRGDTRFDLTFSRGERALLLVTTAILLLTSPAWLGYLFFAGGYDYWQSLLLVPIIFALNVGGIVRMTRQAPSLRRLMLISYTMKIASAGAYMWLLYVYYGSGADATTYFNVGKRWDAFFAAHGSYPVVGHIWGTYFINLVTAVLIGIFGPAFPMLNVMFATAAFWGIFFFYRTYCEVWPDLDHEFGALLFFLLPSCQFWNAAVGKDSLMMLSLGLATFGYSQLLTGRFVKGLSFFLPGMSLGALTRPHVVGMAAVAMFLPYTFVSGKHGLAVKLTRFLGIPAMAAAVAYLVRNAADMLRVDSAQAGLSRIQSLGAGTMHGGSSFGVGQSTTVKVLLSPFLMFRPFPWEIPNVLGLLATAEALVLLYWVWRVRGNVLHSFLQWRSKPVFAFIVGFGALFSLVFSLALSNFGLLIRQKTQFAPLLIMMIAALHPSSIRYQRPFAPRDNTH